LESESNEAVFHFLDFLLLLLLIIIIIIIIIIIYESVLYTLMECLTALYTIARILFTKWSMLGD
jgi:hypothetical protein